MKTIEEKAKAYDEIIERAKTMLAAGEVMYGKENNASQLITDLIPELRESEDERIRKFLLEYAIEMIAGLESDISLSTNDGIKGHDPDAEAELTQWQKARAYLERQKEQKPAEKQDYSGLNDFERAIHRGFLCAGVENVPVTIIKETAQDCLAHLPAERSEEDKANLDNIIWLCENCEKGIENVWIPSQATQIKNLIKSLRPSWKPSEEQLRALNHFLDFHRPQYMASTHGWSAYEGLKSLYDQLFKLK